MITCNISAQGKREIIEYFNKWSESLIKIEKIDNIYKKEVINRDNNFIHLIGNSVYWMSLFNSSIIKHLTLYIKGMDNEDYTFKDKAPYQISITSRLKNIVKVEEIIDYIKFNNGLTCSKVKFFFFKETPVINTNNPYIDWNWEILSNAKKFIKEIFDGKLSSKGKRGCTKYLILVNAMYSIVYNSDINKGNFLRYEYNHAQYIQNKSFLNDRLVEMETGKESLKFNIRLFGSNMYSYSYSNVLDVNDKTKNDIYKNVFKKLNDKEGLSLDPLVFRLTDLLWKVDGMIQDDLEYISNSDKLRSDTIISSLCKNFINTFFKLSEKVYEQRDISYGDFYSEESAFIYELYDYVGADRASSTNIINKFNKINTFNSKGDTISLNINMEKFSLRRFIKSARQHSETGFKIKSLIQNLDDINDLIAIILLWSVFLKKDDIAKPSTECVAVYKSGVFIAHLLNILIGLDKQIWLFKTKPYIATHPLHKDTNKNIHDIYVFDDAFKTGFTNSMYESYLTRNFDKNFVSLQFHSLFNFDGYKPIDSCFNSSTTSLIHLNKNFISKNDQEILFLMDDMNSFATNYRVPSRQQVISAISSSKELFGDEERLDITLFLSSTKHIFAIANIFVQEINKKNIDSKPVYIFSPSDDGEVLSMFVAFLLRLSGNSISFTHINNEESYFIVGIDTVIDSGFTMRYKWVMEKNGFYHPELDNEYADFALVLSVFCRSNITNSYSLIHKED